jgi:hypothetical protein
MHGNFLVSMVVAASLAAAFSVAPQAVAQTGAPGTKQMQDAQRKAEQKARSARKTPSQNVEHQKPASAASSPTP